MAMLNNQRVMVTTENIVDTGTNYGINHLSTGDFFHAQ